MNVLVTVVNYLPYIMCTKLPTFMCSKRLLIRFRAVNKYNNYHDFIYFGYFSNLTLSSIRADYKSVKPFHWLASYLDPNIDEYMYYYGRGEKIEKAHTFNVQQSTHGVAFGLSHLLIQKSKNPSRSLSLSLSLLPPFLFDSPVLSPAPVSGTSSAEISAMAVFAAAALGAFLSPAIIRRRTCLAGWAFHTHT